MSDTEEESKRVSLQVSSLSTQLIESIEKQSRLEEQLVQYKREHEQLKIKAAEGAELRVKHDKLEEQFREILAHNNGLGKKLELETKEKLEAKDEVSKLQSEVEELSASLFGEANKMVNDARREKHEVEKRNESLVSQLKEKDLLLDNLQNQLKELKNSFHERDNEPVLSRKTSFEESKLKNLTPSNSSSQLNLSLNQLQLQQQQPVIYSPTTDSIRFDLDQYQEYKKFIKAIRQSDSIRHTDTKFLKRLIADDIEPALRIDLAPGIGWLSKRSLLASIIDGRVSIEPISGINETYRLNFQNNANNKPSENEVQSNLYSYPAHSPPVAINEPCSLCGEERNDILEHSRLYIMKVHPKTDSSTTSSTSNLSANPAVNQYPLCSFCLFRVRSISELFAFLRSLKTDAWKLTDEITIKKSWVELSRLRSKVFWSMIGIWDIEANIVTTNITPSTDESLIKINIVQNNTNLNSSEANHIVKPPGELERKGSSLKSEIKADDFASIKSTDEEAGIPKYDGNHDDSYIDVVQDITQSYESGDDTPDEAYEDTREEVKQGTPETDAKDQQDDYESTILDQYDNNEEESNVEKIDSEESKINTETDGRTSLDVNTVD